MVTKYHEDTGRAVQCSAVHARAQLSRELASAPPAPPAPPIPLRAWVSVTVHGRDSATSSSDHLLFLFYAFLCLIYIYILNDPSASPCLLPRTHRTTGRCIAKCSAVPSRTSNPFTHPSIDRSLSSSTRPSGRRRTSTPSYVTLLQRPESWEKREGARSRTDDNGRSRTETRFWRHTCMLNARLPSS